MSDEIERLRAHVEKHKHREQAFFSTLGLKTLLEELDRCRRQRDELKTQVERLIASEAAMIEVALRRR